MKRSLLLFASAMLACVLTAFAPLASAETAPPPAGAAPSTAPAAPGAQAPAQPPAPPADPAPAAPARKNKQVKARVLMAGIYGKVGDVVLVDKDEAEASGDLDPHKDSVAYAESVLAAKGPPGGAAAAGDAVIS